MRMRTMFVCVSERREKKTVCESSMCDDTEQCQESSDRHLGVALGMAYMLGGRMITTLTTLTHSDNDR